MPITPHFSLTQDEERVWVDIQVPHVRVSRDSVEVVVEDDDDKCRVHFYANPYLLVLTLPHAIYESDDHVTATLDPMLHGGTIRLTLIKKEPQFWPDLDLLANLLHQRTCNNKKSSSKRTGNVVQEIISETTTTKMETTIAEMENDTDEQEELYNDSSDVRNNHETSSTADHDDDDVIPHYGFNNMFHHIFADLVREGVVFVELPQPDSTPSQERRELRKLAENSKFDPDRYLQDCQVEDDYIFQCAMAMSPHWANNTISTAKITSNATITLHYCLVNNQDTATENIGCNKHHLEEESTVDTIVRGMSQLDTNDQDEVTTVSTTTTTTPVPSSSHDFFTSQELAKLASIPYPLLSKISRHETIGLLLGLIDLLYAYVYDHLLTDGEPTVESAWTVSMLSCSLSWLDVPESSNDSEGTWRYYNTLLLLDVICASLRRTLVYPYLRNHDFGLYCWKQVQIIVANGRRCIMRCLLQMRRILDQSECHYLGNKLLVDPYLAWLQQPRSVTNQDLDQLAVQLHRILSSQQQGILLSKEKLELDLIDIEEDESTESDDEDESSDDEDKSLDDGTESSEENDEDESDKLATTEEGTDTDRTNESNHQVDLVDGAIHVTTPNVETSTPINPSDSSLLDIEDKLETKTGKGQAMPSILIQEL